MRTGTSAAVTPQTWTLDEVTGKLGDCVKAGALKTPTFAPEIDDLLDAIGISQVALADAQPARFGDGATASVSVTGKATILGPLTATVTMTFRVDAGALDVTMTASFDKGSDGKDATIQILGLPWATVGGLTLTLDTVGPSLPIPVVTGSVAGEVDIDSHPIGVTLAPVYGTPDWFLGASMPLPDAATLETLLAAGQKAADLTPPQLDLSGFSIDLSCTFDPDEWKVRSVSAALSGKTWSFATGFPAFDDVGFEVVVDFDDDLAVQDVALTATATVKLGTATALPVVAMRGDGLWTVGIVGVQGLPKLGEMVKAADPATAQLLPDVLADLQLQSMSLELTLGEAAPVLRSIFFRTRLADDWPLITGHLALERVAVQVLADYTGGGTSGFVTGAVKLEDTVEIPVAVEWPPGSPTWSLTLGSDATHELAGMSSLSDLAGGADIAQQLPSGFGGGAVTLTDLSMTVDRATGKVVSAGLELESDGPWPLPGTTDVDVKSLTLTLGWTGGAASAITGSIAGTVYVKDGVALSLTVSKSVDDWTFTGTLTVCKIDITLHMTDTAGVWSFAGTTGPGQQIPLGALVEDLGRHLGTFTLPSSLQRATLSNLDVDFDTKAGTTFRFSGHAQLPMSAGDPPLELDLAIEVSRTTAATGTTTTATFLLTIDKLVFEVAVADDVTQTRLVAAYTHAAGLPAALIPVGSLVKAVDPSAPALPDLQVDVREVVLASASGGGAAGRVLFALDLGAIDLTKLPLVGSLLSEATVDDLQVVAATAALVAGDLDAWNELLHKSGAKPLPQGIEKGIAVSAVLRLAELTTPVALPAGAPAPVTKTASAATTAPAADDTKWYPVKRSFGPAYVDRVGARYDAGVLWLLLDASLTLGGLSLSLMGLAAGSPLSAFEPQFGLDGLGLAFSEDPVEIAGSFLAVPKSALKSGVEFQYDGAAVVRAETFALAAVGSYAKLTDGEPSLFIFAELDTPLGGPPALYITGLMGGFGYNRSLTIPDQDEVFQFPFLQGLTGKGSGNGTPLGVLGELEQGWLTVDEGVDWIAVGVTFTSFEVVESKALLVAEFGRRLQLALIGLSTLQLPQDASVGEQFAYLELELEAILKPDEGFFGLTARLSPNSFVIDRACRLTGGFAFYVWFEGDHAGDFVLTLGGYHPAFKIPSHYPQEPRLGLSWPVNDLVTIDGSAFFALTPSCVMGGGGLDVLFHDGNLRAWLTASADFLISWQPFRYSVGIGVSVGVSYLLSVGAIQKTLSVELAAQLSLWGPPTGGTAHVSWYVISFTVGFGAEPPSEPKKKTFDWTNDLQPLLPQRDLCKIGIQSGLLAGARAGLDGGTSAAKAAAAAQPVDGEPWLVRADTLTLATECAVPATQLLLGSEQTVFSATPGTAPAVRPLGLAALKSAHALTLVRDGASGSTEIDLQKDGWTIHARTRDMPSSLWGAPLGQDGSPLQGDSLVKGQLAGFAISPPGVRWGAAIDLIPSIRDVQPGGALPATDEAGGPVPKAAGDDALKAIGDIANADVAAKRAAVRSALHARGLDPGTDDALGTFVAKAVFAVPPLLLEAAT